MDFCHFSGFFYRLRKIFTYSFLKFVQKKYNQTFFFPPSKKNRREYSLPPEDSSAKQ